MTRIFISYRRADSAGITGRIDDRLRRFYGSQHVFRDVETIRAGEHFGDVIDEAVGASDVQLVIIGPTWLTLRDEQGSQRLGAPSDLLTLEVAAGLANKDVRVIPVLVQGALMPRADELPEQLRGLSMLNALEVRDTRFDVDVDELVIQIGGNGRKRWTRWAWGVAVAASLIVAMGGVSLSLLAPSPPVDPDNDALGVLESRSTTTRAALTSVEAPSEPQAATTTSQLVEPIGDVAQVPSTAALATTTTVLAPVIDLQRGLFCRDLAALGYAYRGSIAYWMLEGAPDRMDADLNGIPCETQYSSDEINQFLVLGLGLDPGMFCRDLDARGLTFEVAIAYWLLEGAPDRMDADVNGLPCETVYSTASILSFLEAQ